MAGRFRVIETRTRSVTLRFFRISSAQTSNGAQPVHTSILRLSSGQAPGQYERVVFPHPSEITTHPYVSGGSPPVRPEPVEGSKGGVFLSRHYRICVKKIVCLSV